MQDNTVAPVTRTARIGRRIQRARLSRNLTQGALAKGEFSVSYLSAVERGQSRPSLDALERLATRLRVPLSDLVTDAHDATAIARTEGREG